MESVASETTDRDELRKALIDAAAKLIANEGPSALTLRRVANEVGTSTMAIYTSFGGMPELRRAVRHEGFERLTTQLARVEETDDPVEDLWMLGAAYYVNAIFDPDLYRVAFMEQPLDSADVMLGTRAFKSLTSAVERCIASGRFAAADATEHAMEFWALGHGVIALQLAQLLSPEEAESSLDRGVRRLFRSWGDDPEAIERSARNARARAERAGSPLD